MSFKTNLHQRLLNGSAFLAVAGLLLLVGCSTPKATPPAPTPPTPVKVVAVTPPPIPVDIARLALEHIAKGEQEVAEGMLAAACKSSFATPEVVFLNTACLRSRFEIGEALMGWVQILLRSPKTPMGQAAACILGQDLATNTPTALYYFSGLMVVARNNPKDTVIHWMVAVMSRALTRDSTNSLADATRQRIIAYGIEEYRTVLAQFAPGVGPTLVHQTLANLLTAMEDSSTALQHYRIVQERARLPWALENAATTLERLGRWKEVLDLSDEALAQTPESAHALATRGNALWAMDRCEEALNTWLRIPPEGRYDWQLSTGQQALAAGYPDLARLFLQQALKLDPNDKVAAVLLGRIAVMEDMPGACEALLKLGTINWQDKYVPAITGPDDTPWFRAIESGDIAAVRSLLATTPVDTVSQKYHATALMTAAHLGWTEIVKTLLVAGARINLADVNRDTALHYASQFKQPACVQLLLAAGANSNLLDQWGQTPLAMSVQGYEWKTARMLINHPGIDLNICATQRGTALHVAAGYGQADIVRMLLDHHADINLANSKDGETPLMATCLDYRHPDALVTLLEAGAEVNTQDRQGRTALRCAIQPTPTSQLTDALLRHGANPLIADKNGVTPIAAAHLLGYAKLAARMEAITGGPPPVLPWTLPMLARPDDATNTEAELNAFTLPIALIHGLPLEPILKATPAKVKKQAIEALKSQFGIASAEAFKEAIISTDRLLPFNHTNKLATRLDAKYPQYAARLDNMVGQIFYAGMPAKTGPLAWRKSHLIHLARLGAIAGYIPESEADQICTGACEALRGTFTSWAEFTASFIFGAIQHEGWERQRYEHICQILLTCPPESSPWQDKIWQPAQAPSTPSGTSGSTVDTPVASTAPRDQKIRRSLRDRGRGGSQCLLGIRSFYFAVFVNTPERARILT